MAVSGGRGAEDEELDDWEPKIEVSPWDHRLTVVGVLLAVGGALLIPCLTKLPYADVSLDLHGPALFHLGDLNLWSVQWDRPLLRRSGTVDERDETQWKYHVMHLCGHDRWHRNITDDIIAMKLTHEGKLENKTETAWQYPAARSALEALRDMAAVFLYLQTALSVALSLSICGLSVLPIRTIRTSNQAMLMCLTTLVTTIVTAVGAAKVGARLEIDMRHIVPVQVFGHDAVVLEWRGAAHLLVACAAAHGAAFLFALYTHCATRGDPYPRGQGPNFPSAINGERMPPHYLPYGNNERGPDPNPRPGGGGCCVS